MGVAASLNCSIRRSSATKEKVSLCTFYSGQSLETKFAHHKRNVSPFVCPLNSKYFEEKTLIWLQGFNSSFRVEGGSGCQIKHF